MSEVVSHLLGALAGLVLLYAAYVVGMLFQFYGRML